MLEPVATENASGQTTRPSPSVEFRQNLDKIIAESDLRRQARGQQFEARRERATQDFLDFNDTLRELGNEDARQFTDQVAKHQKEARQMDEEMDAPMVKYKNEKMLINNLGKAASMTNLTEADLPENLPKGVTPVQVQEMLTAYLSHYLGFDGHPSGVLPNDMTTEAVSRLMAMPNETTSQLFRLIKDQWQGKTPLTEEEVALWVHQRIVDPKNGVASVVSYRDKDNPDNVAPADQKINMLRDVLMITSEPGARKKLTETALRWYSESATQRHQAQGKPMAVRISPANQKAI